MNFHWSQNIQIRTVSEDHERLPPIKICVIGIFTKHKKELLYGGFLLNNPYMTQSAIFQSQKGAT